MNSLTVFTATYNRSNLLIRLYDSLKCQTCLNFEWIVIDDGSSDDTISVLRNISKENVINFKYLVMDSNGGKHRAINKGLDLATGDYFFIVDSDDVLPSNAIEKINSYIGSIEGQNDFAGVAGLKAHFDGKICGGKTALPKHEYVDATNFERVKYHLLDDKAEVYKTAVMRDHKFPEYEGEKFVSEAICWDAIASEGKKLRWFNDVIYLCEYLDDGLSRSGANQRYGHMKNIKGYTAYVKQALKVKPQWEAVADFREFNETCKEMRIGLKNRSEMLDCSECRYVWNLVMTPPLYILRKILYFHYKIKRC